MIKMNQWIRLKIYFWIKVVQSNQEVVIILVKGKIQILLSR